MDIAYDGTGFHGWQRQPGLRTVQGTLETALAEVVGAVVSLSGAGRTDAGCHARGQVGSFRTASRLPARALAPKLRRLLPEDVQVLRATEVEADFHARRSAQARRYAYRLLDRPDVLLGRMAWHVRRPIDAEALEQAVRPLEGRHDCSAFAARGCSARTPVCVVHRAGWRRWEGGLMLDLLADHFLYHMVRNIVGTALELAQAVDPAAAMRRVIASRSRERAGATAPAHGLCLEAVQYPGGCS